MDDYSSGLSIEQANSHTLGGLMGVADTLDDYAHERWATKQRFLALSYTDGTEGNRTNDFDDIYSTTTGTNVVESSYTYEGYWTKEWEDTDGDGIATNCTRSGTPRAALKIFCRSWPART